jgi:hypothetical protein
VLGGPVLPTGPDHGRVPTPQSKGRTPANLLSGNLLFCRHQKACLPTVHSGQVLPTMPTHL